MDFAKKTRRTASITTLPTTEDKLQVSTIETEFEEILDNAHRRSILTQIGIFLLATLLYLALIAHLWITQVDNSRVRVYAVTHLRPEYAQIATGE